MKTETRRLSQSLQRSSWILLVATSCAFAQPSVKHFGSLLDLNQKSGTNQTQQFSGQWTSQPSRVTGTGGSNFVQIKQSDYGPEMPSGELSACQSTFMTGDNRSMIGVYNLAQSTINARVDAMYQSGQRSITLLLWHETTSTKFNNDMWCFISMNHGTLTTQQAQNLQNLLLKIKATGFQQINFRFEPMGYSNPSTWSGGWDENQYQANWSLIYNTHRLITATIGQSPRVLYDLGGEYGGAWLGAPNNNQPANFLPYVKRLWSDYTFAFGLSDTMGFSIVPDPGFTAAQIAAYDATGKGRPIAYGFDVYGNPQQVSQGNYSTITLQINTAAQELAQAKELGKEIFLQESYFNSSTNRSVIDQASILSGLSIRYIFQWPLQFGTNGTANNVDWMAPYSSYLPHSGDTLPVYRFYKPSTGEHFFTLNYNEGISAGFTSEGVGFGVFAGIASGTAPIYRCYPRFADHFISRDATCEGQVTEGLYGYLPTTQLPGTKPLYRMYNPTINRHLETLNEQEGLSNGYHLESILGYLPSQLWP